MHGNGPLLILAGAGSGKTSTMAYRIAHLISERGVSSTQVLGLSFTNKAARELKERVVKMLVDARGFEATKGLTISTFHALCVRLLREYGDRLGFQKNFTIVDRGDQTDILRATLKRIKVDDRKFDPDWLLFQFGQFKNKLLPMDSAEGFFLEKLQTGRMHADYAVVAASAFPKYQEQLKLLNSLDFDDLIFQCVALLRDHADARARVNERFRHILVDEYQDTNPAQFAVLRALTERARNLCVVGDDDQSIYAWRGADPAHILEFRHQFPDAKLITLDQNYRSTSTILEAANEVIARNPLRHPKKLWSNKGRGQLIEQRIATDDRSEAEMVAEKIRSLAMDNIEGQPRQLRAWKDFAVLYRSNSQSRLFEEALRARGVPYKMVGALSFMDRKEVKDLLCYWRLILNPKDDSALRRILNWPARGIGKSSIEALVKHGLEQGLPLIESLRASETVAPRAAAGAETFLSRLDQARAALSQTPADPARLAAFGQETLRLFEFKRGIQDDVEDEAQAQKRWENVEELVNSLGQVPVSEVLPEAVAPTGEDLFRETLARFTLDAQDEKDKDKDDDRDQATLMTLHGSKGLEFPIVFLVGAEDGYLPHQRAIDEAADLSEERRLCYVGITRAKEALFITRAKHRIRYGKAVPRNPSRFLEEIPARLMNVADETGTPDPTNAEAVEKHESMVKDFLAQLRGKLT